MVLPMLIQEMKTGNANSRSAVLLILQISFMSETIMSKRSHCLKYNDAKQLVEGLSIAAQASPKLSEHFQNFALERSYIYNLQWNDIPEPIQEKSKKSCPML